MWKAAGRGPELKQPNAIITPQAEREKGGLGLYSMEEAERWIGKMNKVKPGRERQKAGDRLGETEGCLCYSKLD